MLKYTSFFFGWGFPKQLSHSTTETHIGLFFLLQFCSQKYNAQNYPKCNVHSKLHLRVGTLDLHPSIVRDDIHKNINYFKRALPVKLRPPPRLNGQGGPFSGRQKRHLSAYYRIKFKLILIIKMVISVMKIVIILMIMVMKMTKKNGQCPFEIIYFLYGCRPL